MSKKSIKPIALAVSAAFATGMAATAAQADENPFAMSTLSSGYEVPMPDGQEKGKDDAKKGEEGKCGEGKCGEGKCGDDKKKGEEGKCGEGKCGEGKKKGEEGKCGEGKCGDDKKKGEEGKCGGAA